MENYLPIIHSLVLFTIVSIFFLFVLNIILKIIVKKFNIDNINVYGMFFNMKKKTIFSFCISTLTYVMLVWLLIDLNLNYIYVSVMLTMTIISNLLEDDFPHGFLNIINIIACLLSIAFLSYFNDLILNKDVLIFLILKWIVIIFLFMYYTYTTLLNLNHLLGTEKNRIVNKRGNKNEYKEFDQSS